MPRYAFAPFLNLALNSGRLNSSGLVRADGVIHAGHGYVAPPPLFTPAGDFTGIPEDADEPILAHVNRSKLSNGDFTIYFYAEGELYRIDVTGDPPWTVAGCGSVSTDLDSDEGGFVSFGESEIFAAGHANHVQIRRDGQANFENCFTSTDKPKAKHVAALGSRLIFGNLANLDSAKFDPTTQRSLLWYGGTDSPRIVGTEKSHPKLNTGFQPIADDYGDIRGLANGRDQATIFKELSIWTMDLEGAAGFFFHPLRTDCGLAFTHSIAQLLDEDFFWSTNGPASVRDGQVIFLGDGFWNERGLLLESPARPSFRVLSAAADVKNSCVYWLVEYDAEDYSYADGNPPTETVSGSGKVYALLAYNQISNQFSFVWRVRTDAGGILLADESSPSTAHRFRPLCLVDRIPWKNSLPMDGIGILAVEDDSTNPAGPRYPQLFLAGLPSTSWTPEWTLGHDVVLQTGFIPINGTGYGAVVGVRPIARARRGQSLPAMSVRVFSAKTPWQPEKRSASFSSVDSRGFIKTPGVQIGNLIAVELTIAARSTGPTYAFQIDELEGVELEFDGRGGTP